MGARAGTRYSGGEFAPRLGSPLTESVQRALDERHAASIRRAAAVREPAALAAWWRERVDGPELARALWATLTQPRFTPSVAETVLGDVHLLQHQAGAARRGRYDEHEGRRDRGLRAVEGLRGLEVLLP